jgi:hypothetical protein
MTKRNGDHFEGHWVEDQREGQGSYLYHEKNKLFVGEWVKDQPKTGVYTEVIDEDAPKTQKKPQFTDEYKLPSIPELKLADPTRILEKAMERTKQQRATYRVQHIPIEEMFTAQELTDLRHAFELESKGEAFINMDSLTAIFAGMQIFPTQE